MLYPLLQGCAGTARGKAASTYSFDDTVEVTDVSRSQADAWVVLRYPAMIEEGAEARWNDAYGREPIGGRVSEDGWLMLDTESIAQGAIAKSNFYAMSLYRELRGRWVTGFRCSLIWKASRTSIII